MAKAKKTKKKTAPKKKAAKRSTKKAAAREKAPKLASDFHKICYVCKQPNYVGHHCVPLTEGELFAALDEDLQDAWHKLREQFAALGEQRIYNNANAVMFARKVCYAFVRPKKKYLELVLFLPRREDAAPVHKVEQQTKTKYCHTIRLIHADQVEEPLTDWLREGYDFVGA